MSGSILSLQLFALFFEKLEKQNRKLLEQSEVGVGQQSALIDRAIDVFGDELMLLGNQSRDDRFHFFVFHGELVVWGGLDVRLDEPQDELLLGEALEVGIARGETPTRWRWIQKLKRPEETLRDPKRP